MIVHAHENINIQERAQRSIDNERSMLTKH